ncbi:hypothetical protein G4D63_19120 [Bacillus mesophilus]|uniref:Uncharacterized protein n=1 Tax=Bacillus mesophilus TaxID=1808955 RepID=A0A6M0QBR5_9BACI|nr:hypothetical protein [Bacillus mesophilus]
MPNIVRLLLIIFPWISVVFLPKKSFGKFMPIAFISSFLVAGMCAMAVPLKWWKIKGGWKGKVINDLSFILGPFFVGTIWVFHLTYGNFKRYLFINSVLDLSFSFLLSNLFQRMKLFRLVHFKPWQIFVFFMSFALFIYGLQRIIDRKKFHLESGRPL